ncbi:hypothetical protein FRC06_009378, partial [Ceratobasidium sp. 370]
SNQPLKPEVPVSGSETDVVVLGQSVMEEIQRDMEHTIIPSWLKAPPKGFGMVSHGKLGAEEYKS